MSGKMGSDAVEGGWREGEKTKGWAHYTASGMNKRHGGSWKVQMDISRKDGVYVTSTPVTKIINKLTMQVPLTSLSPAPPSFFGNHRAS